MGEGLTEKILSFLSKLAACDLKKWVSSVISSPALTTKFLFPTPLADQYVSSLYLIRLLELPGCKERKRKFICRDTRKNYIKKTAYLNKN